MVLWLTPAVIARGQAVSLRHREFVDAARAGGMTEWQIIRQHIVPNSMNVVIVYSSLLVLEVIVDRIVPQLPRPRRPGAGDILGLADR